MKAADLDDAVLACLEMHPGSPAREIASTICGTVDEDRVLPRVYNSLARLKAGDRVAHGDGDKWDRRWRVVGPRRRVVLTEDDARATARLLGQGEGAKSWIAQRLVEEIARQLRGRR